MTIILDALSCVREKLNQFTHLLTELENGKMIMYAYSLSLSCMQLNHVG